MNLLRPSATVLMMDLMRDPDEPLEALEDEWVVVRCQLGEAEALEALVRRWHAPLWQYARRVSGADDRAADVVQDVWLRVLRGLSRLREPARFRPWLFGIARHVLMDRLREQYRAPAAADVDLSDVPADPPEPDPEPDLARLQAVLADLPIVERDVLVLFYLEELSLAGLADVLQVPVGTVKSRLFRARRLLRARLTAGEESS